ncbi:MAG: hypothetical protein K0A99_12675 [Desulfoarculaceae bacterium]|nr:hypothetical protein [Desulfoarculaceae bacterium]
MIEDIATKIRDAAHINQKIAMFHFQVLINADKLKGLDPMDFCKDIGVTRSYATEFRKMLSLAKLMKEEGVRISGR